MFYDHSSNGKGIFASKTPFGGSSGAGQGARTQGSQPSTHSGGRDPRGNHPRHEGYDPRRDQGFSFQSVQAAKLTPYRSVPTIRGAPPSSRRAHLLTTCPEGKWWYPSRWSGRALLTEAPPGLPLEGPAMPQAVIAGAVGRTVAGRCAAAFRHGTQTANCLCAAPCVASSFFGKRSKKHRPAGRERRLNIIWLSTI